MHKGPGQKIILNVRDLWALIHQKRAWLCHGNHCKGSGTLKDINVCLNAAPHAVHKCGLMAWWLPWRSKYVTKKPQVKMIQKPSSLFSGLSYKACLDQQHQCSGAYTGVRAAYVPSDIFLRYGLAYFNKTVLHCILQLLQQHDFTEDPGLQLESHVGQS